tara:strand:- start:3789 stop:5978 length:2190 start_codon:yes stop_codon:yes gene_type:complete
MIFSIVLATVITIHPNFLLAQSTDDTLAIRMNPTEKDCIESCFSVKAVRIMIPPKIDGILDELFWNEIEPITDFRQRIPVDGGNPTEKTEVRIAYDQDNLYFGFKLLDSEPDKIIRTILQREGKVPFDDRVAIGIDTFNDDRNGYVFGMNAYGTQEDGQFTDEGRVDWVWESVYLSEGRITDKGWELEVAIPFTTIRFPRTEPIVMGLVLYRRIRRKNEDVFWPPMPQRFRAGMQQASQYADLVGLENLRRSRNIEIKPFAITGAQRSSEESNVDFLRDFGADVKYSLTSNLTLDLTWNTDFAQADADNAQVNLTRFSLFFPEKREFFLERSGLFTFGERRQTEAFFSRQIGIDNDILGGGRLTGQAGPLSIGILNLQTRSDGDVLGTNNAVARIRVDVLPRTTIGGIFTNLHSNSGHNRVGGGDIAIRFWNSSSLKIWGAKVWDSKHLSGSTFAGSTQLDIANDLWQIGASVVDVGDDYQPGLGLVIRRDMIRYRGKAGLTPRFEKSTWARQLDLTTEGTYIEGQDGNEQTTEVKFDSKMMLRSDDYLTIQGNRKSEVLEQPFRIRPGLNIPTGRYEFSQFGAVLGTNRSRPISGKFTFSSGSFFNGDRTQLKGELRWSTGSHLVLIFTADRNDISLPVENGDFSTTVLGLTPEIAINRKLFANGIIQYDSDSKKLQTNFRINWIHTPGSDLFLVMNTGYLMGDNFDPHQERWTQRAGVVKLTYLKRL